MTPNEQKYRAWEAARRGKPAAASKRRTPGDQWQYYQREYRAELTDAAKWEALPEACQASIARAKRAALGVAALTEREKRASDYREPVRKWSVAATYSVR